MTSAASLKEYLKRYQSGDDPKDGKRKKKKTAASKSKPSLGGGVLIVDEDPTWQKPITLKDPTADDTDSAGEDNPVVDVDIEVKRLRRLEEIRARKPYLSVSEDGSGWVSVSDVKGGSLRDSTRPGRRKDTPSPVRDSGPPDLSPPRQRNRRRFQTLSPELDDDSYPPRKGRGGTPGQDDARLEDVRRNYPEADISPPRRRRRNAVDLSPDADLSPPRHTRSGSPEVGISPQRRPRRSSSEFGRSGLPKDLPPPRRVRSPKSDLSSPRHSRRTSPGSELSPTRRARKNSPDISLSRRAERGSPGSDLSPVRRRRKGSPLKDLSPPRRGRRNSPESDLSPPRRDRKGSADVNIQLPRIPRGDSVNVDVPAVTDMPPPMRKRKITEREMGSHQGVEHSKHRESGNNGLLDEGKRIGGLYTGSEMGKEINKKNAETLSRFESLDPTKSGKGAEPTYRFQGKKVSKEEKLKLEKGDEKPKEKKLEWGKGLAQKREAEAKVLEIELEKEKPFARSRDDPELDKMLKERIRWGDPMAHLVKRKDLDFDLKDFGEDEKMKESGFIVPQTIPNHSWIKRGLDPPPNRYGIKPGRHWDGVDRSTGYEKGLFQRQNEKQATQTEAYLWSVADM